MVVKLAYNAVSANRNLGDEYFSLRSRTFHELIVFKNEILQLLSKYDNIRGEITLKSARSAESSPDRLKISL